MEKAIRRAKDSNSSKTRCPISLTAEEFLGTALENTGSSSLDDMLKKFNKASTFKIAFLK